MGRAMLNICIVFAQLERETIQKRVRDAYYSRCQKGFHVSGKAPYGYRLEPTVIEGINTKMMAEEPEAAKHVKLMFDMYAQPNISFGDVTRYFVERGITFDGREPKRLTISYMLRNPVYVQADLEIYEFFKGQGADILNDVSDFNGTNGCYLYQGRDVPDSKFTNLRDQILVLAPHEGMIPSDIWLACRRKLMKNAGFGATRKAKNTWLAGKIKCGHCGAALSALSRKNANYAYFRCRRFLDSKACSGCGTLRVCEAERLVYDEMRKKMDGFQTLTGGSPSKANPKLTARNVELVQVENEIGELLDTLAGANATLLSYANTKIEELDAKRQELMKTIADLTVESMSPEQVERISHHLDNWESISYGDRRLVADGLLTRVKATSDTLKIEWKI